MKYLMCLVVLVLLAGCTKPNSMGSTYSGGKEFNKICIDGVEYLQRVQGYGGYLAPHMKVDGTVYKCGEQPVQ